MPVVALKAMRYDRIEPIVAADELDDHENPVIRPTRRIDSDGSCRTADEGGNRGRPQRNEGARGQRGFQEVSAVCMHDLMSL